MCVHYFSLHVFAAFFAFAGLLCCIQMFSLLYSNVFLHVCVFVLYVLNLESMYI